MAEKGRKLPIELQKRIQRLKGYESISGTARLVGVSRNTVKKYLVKVFTAQETWKIKTVAN